MPPGMRAVLAAAFLCVLSVRSRLHFFIRYPHDAQEGETMSGVAGTKKKQFRSRGGGSDEEGEGEEQDAGPALLRKPASTKAKKKGSGGNGGGGNGGAKKPSSAMLSFDDDEEEDGGPLARPAPGKSKLKKKAFASKVRGGKECEGKTNELALQGEDRVPIGWLADSATDWLWAWLNPRRVWKRPWRPMTRGRARARPPARPLVGGPRGATWPPPRAGSTRPRSWRRSRRGRTSRSAPRRAMPRTAGRASPSSGRVRGGHACGTHRVVSCVVLDVRDNDSPSSSPVFSHSLLSHHHRLPGPIGWGCGHASIDGSTPAVLHGEEEGGAAGQAAEEDEDKALDEAEIRRLKKEKRERMLREAMESAGGGGAGRTGEGDEDEDEDYIPLDGSHRRERPKAGLGEEDDRRLLDKVGPVGLVDSDGACL